MQPQFADETPINPFDLWTGADFRLKIRNVEGYRNYDKSEFDKPSQLFDGDDERLSELYDRLHKLSEFVDPTKYKSYDELKKKFQEVVGAAALSNERSAEASRSSVGSSAPEPSLTSANTDEAEEEEDGDSSLSYFAQLAKK